MCGERRLAVGWWNKNNQNKRNKLLKNRKLSEHLSMPTPAHHWKLLTTGPWRKRRRWTGMIYRVRTSLSLSYWWLRLKIAAERREGEPLEAVWCSWRCSAISHLNIPADHIHPAVIFSSGWLTLFRNGVRNVTKSWSVGCSGKTSLIVKALHCNFQNLKDLLLMSWCLMEQATFRGLWTPGCGHSKGEIGIIFVRWF